MENLFDLGFRSSLRDGVPCGVSVGWYCLPCFVLACSPANWRITSSWAERS